MVYLVPWLWTYKASDFDGMTQVSASHSCHRNTDDVICINQDHLTLLELSENKGLNYCAPCICTHVDLCEFAGPEFVQRMNSLSPTQILDIRNRIVAQYAVFKGLIESSNLAPTISSTTTTTTISSTNTNTNNPETGGMK
jgi:hypothetical protein